MSVVTAIALRVTIIIVVNCLFVIDLWWGLFGIRRSKLKIEIKLRHLQRPLYSLRHGQ